MQFSEKSPEEKMSSAQIRYKISLQVLQHIYVVVPAEKTRKAYVEVLLGRGMSLYLAN